MLGSLGVIGTEGGTFPFPRLASLKKRLASLKKILAILEKRLASQKKRLASTHGIAPYDEQEDNTIEDALRE